MADVFFDDVVAPSGPFGITRAIQSAGGLHVVETTANLTDATIPAGRRIAGMEVNVKTPPAKYKLGADLTTWTASASRTVYLSPSGLDTNNGLTYDMGVLTPARALAILGPDGGTVVMRQGVYGWNGAAGVAPGITFDLTNTARVTIRAELSNRTKVYFGEKKTGFTLHSGSGDDRVWKTAITEVIPPDQPVAGPKHGSYVFEEGTPEGEITPATAHPLQKQRGLPIDAAPGGTAFRNEHFRLRWTTDLATLVAGGAGQAGKFWYEAGMLYFRRSDSDDPNGSNGIWIPAQLSTVNFVKGGNLLNHFECIGVDIFFAGRAFDARSFTSYKLQGCLIFGATAGGTLAMITDHCEEVKCEYACCGEDGSDWFGHGELSMTEQNTTKALVVDCWGHDNADQAISPHQGTDLTVIGGLFEHNGNGGILGGGNIHAIGATSRNNEETGYGHGIGGATLGASCQSAEFNDCHSIDDENGYQSGTDGNIVVRGGSISGATVSAFRGGAGGNQSIAAFDVDLNGNAALTSGTDAAITFTNSNKSTVAGLPSAAKIGAGKTWYVSDAAGSPCLAFSNGTAWKRCDDATVTVT